MIENLSAKHPDAFDVPRSTRPVVVWKDWDRALGRVEPSLGRLWTVAEPYGVDVKQIQEEYAEARRLRKAGKDGGSCEPLSAVEKQIVAIADAQRAAGDPDPVSMAKVAADYAAYKPKDAGERLTYADTPGLVQRVYESGAPTFVKTYGVSESWQVDFKIAGGKYPGYTETLEHTNKAAEQESYRNPETGMYDCYVVDKITQDVRDIVSAPAVVGIDDKVTSLLNGPDDFTGYLLRRGGEEILAEQQGEWPAELTIHSLGQLVMDEGRVVRLDNPVADYPKEMPASDILYVPVNYGMIS